MLTPEEANGIHPWGAVMWGSNMGTRASRLKGFRWGAKDLDVIVLSLSYSTNNDSSCNAGMLSQA